MRLKKLLSLLICAGLFFASGCIKKPKSEQSTDSKEQASSSQTHVESSLPTQSIEYSTVESSIQESSVDESSSESSQTVSESTSSPEVSEVSEVSEVIVDCKLIVNGKDITSGNYVKLNVTKRYAELPFTAVLKGLGATVEWQNETTAKIVFDEKEFTLDTVNSTLIEKGGFQNMLFVAPGSQHGKVSKVIDDEFVIDSDSTKLILQRLGFKINIDYKKAVVNIELLN